MSLVPTRRSFPVSRRKVLALAAAAPLPAALAAAPTPPLPPTVADGARLETFYEEDLFFEGPTWHPGTTRLYVSAFGKDNSRVLQLDLNGAARVWMDRSQGLAHTCLARDGRLLAALAFAHQVVSLRIALDGPEDVRILSKGHAGVPFLRPTDVAQSPTTGLVYVADPNFEGKIGSGVYLIGADGRTRRIVEHLKQPTGLEVTNDGKLLLVSDSFDKRIYSYPLLDDGTVDQGAVKLFFDPRNENQNDADGMCTDADGRCYFAMRGGIWVTGPAGETLGLIPVPEFCTNAAFGGDDGRTLFITASKKVYSLRMRVRGRNVA